MRLSINYRDDQSPVPDIQCNAEDLYEGAQHDWTITFDENGGNSVSKSSCN